MLGWDDLFRVDLHGSVNTNFLENMSNEELEVFIKEQTDLSNLNNLDKE